jgi:hypothetical protein
MARAQRLWWKKVKQAAEPKALAAKPKRKRSAAYKAAPAKDMDGIVALNQQLNDVLRSLPPTVPARLWHKTLA